MKKFFASIIILCRLEYSIESFFIRYEYSSWPYWLQDYVPKEDLMQAIKREFVNRTNEVGVDVNKIVQNVYLGNLLQYICGLGSRKATAMIKLLKQTNRRLENRTMLVTHCHMGPKVFMNCAGFIKIDTNALGDR